MTWTDYDRFLLSLMGWRESRNGGYEAMRSVMHVAKNRSVSEKRPLHRIITDDAQFTSINPPAKTYDPQLDVWPRQPDVRFDEAMSLAEKITLGTDDDPTQGSLFYWNPTTSAKGCWFERNIASRPDEYELIVSIGSHDFYRTKRG